MAYEPSTRRYRNWYATLLRLYPKSYYERFGEGMEQTFNDLLRECRETEGRLLPFALWMFVETFIGILKENITLTIMQNKRIIYIALATAGILLIPLIAMQFTDEVNWDLTDFIVMGTLIFGTGLAYELIAKRMASPGRRILVGVLLAVLFLYIWAELAVGIFNIPGISGS